MEQRTSQQALPTIIHNPYQEGVSAVLERLQTSQNGLSTPVAEERLRSFGPNKIEAKKQEPLWKVFLRQFSDVMVIILILASIISFGITWFTNNVQTGGEHESYVDGIVILIIVFLNAVIGFIQEYKAEKSLEALQKMISPRAVVIRDGEETEIDVADLVPGDIILLEEGAAVPADTRLIEATNLQCIEAALTGESTPVQKHTDPIKEAAAIGDRKNMVFMGTIVSAGRGVAVVTATGTSTEFGKIAKLTLDVKEEKSPLQKELAKVGAFIAKATLLISAIIFVFGLIEGKKLLHMFIYAVSVAVAAVPEGLPATITIALAFGVRRMAKKKSIIKKLSSVETLGSTTVICSDKTGTLTKNQMTVREAYTHAGNVTVTGTGYSADGKFVSKTNDSATRAPELKHMLIAGALCNNAHFDKTTNHVIGDPTEAALLVSTEKFGIDTQALRHANKRIKEFPFDSKRKLMSTINQTPDGTMLFVKGAPDIILSKCTHILKGGKPTRLTQQEREHIQTQNLDMASRALRVLGFAYRTLTNEETKHAIKKQEPETLEDHLVFIGLQGMIDPPREEVIPAVAACKRAGIKIYIVTGDHGITARAIAEKIGIASHKTKVITGQDLAKLRDEELKEELKNPVIFARVNPEHKLRVVSLLKEQGEIVAVTGDGVNDAPALKKADIGVAMGITGTDVSKEASDMILLDDSFATIVSAIKEGRTIYDNITKFMRFLFTSNLGELVTVFLGLFIIPFLSLPKETLIVTAVQVLWINLLTDALPALALGVEPPEKDVMEKPPRNQKQRLVTNKIFLSWLFTGLVIGAGTLFSFLYSLTITGAPMEKATTVAFTTLVLFQLVNVFNCKSKTKSIFKTKIRDNLFLIKAVLVSFLLQLLVIYEPTIMQYYFKTTSLSLQDWLLILPIALSVLVYEELRKAHLRYAERKKAAKASTPSPNLV